MKKLFLPLAIASLAVSSFANAKDGAFVSLYTGTNFGAKLTGSSSSKLKTGQSFGFGAGYNYQDWSFSGTIDTRELKFKNGSNKFESNILLANALYNFNNIHSVVVPYVGYGLGMAQSKTTGTGGLKLKNTIAHQLQAGAKFNINEHLQAFADLRYTGTFKAKLKGSNSTGKYGVNYYSVNVGLQYNI